MSPPARTAPRSDPPPHFAEPPAALLARVLRNDSRAREACLEALHAATRAGDEWAAGLAATMALLDTLGSFSDFRSLPLLLAVFDRFDALAASGMSAAETRRADAVRLNLPSLDHHRHHDDPALAPARQRLFEAVRAGDGMAPDERVLLAKLLVDHDGMRNDLPAVEHVLALMNGAIGTDGVSPLWQGRWWVLVMSNAEYWGRVTLAREALSLLQALLTAQPLPELALALAREEMRMSLRADDLLRAQRAFQQIEQLRAHVRPTVLPHGLRAQASLLLRRGDYDAVLERVALIEKLCADHEVPERDRAGYVEMRASAFTGMARHDDALAVLQALRPTQVSGQAEVLEALIALTQAVRALDRSGDADPAARVQCAQALRRCAAVGYTRFLIAHPAWAARVAAIGLEDGICTAFVTEAVRERAMPPPQPWRTAWPWRLRVQVLGGLHVWRDDAALAGGAKAQRRPMELLALLAAHPAGLAASELIDALWPSLEADAPKASLEMAIARLRKWLDWPEAVRVADGRVLLHPGSVWTDVAAFEAAAAAGDAAAAIALYRGAFMAGQRLEGLALRVRERLAARLAAVVLKAAAAQRAAGRSDEALALIAQAMAAEPEAAALRAAL